MFKPFFVHINANKPGKMTHKHPRGFTLYVFPSTKGENLCQVGMAVCNPKDEYVKAVGRKIALDDDAIALNKRLLPGFVANLHQNAGNSKAEARHFDYLLRNFL